MLREKFLKQPIIKIDYSLKFSAIKSRSKENKYIRLIDRKLVDKDDANIEILPSISCLDTPLDTLIKRKENTNDRYILISYVVAKDDNYWKVVVAAILSGLLAPILFLLDMPLFQLLSLISSCISLKMIYHIITFRLLSKCKIVDNKGLCVDFKSYTISNGIKF